MPLAALYGRHHKRQNRNQHTMTSQSLPLSDHSRQLGQKWMAPHLRLICCHSRGHHAIHWASPAHCIHIWLGPMWCLCDVPGQPTGVVFSFLFFSFLFMCNVRFFLHQSHAAQRLSIVDLLPRQRRVTLQVHSVVYQTEDSTSGKVKVRHLKQCCRLCGGHLS